MAIISAASPGAAGSALSNLNAEIPGRTHVLAQYNVVTFRSDSQRELFRRRIAVLFASDSAIVFLGCFEKFEMAVSCRTFAAVAK